MKKGRVELIFSSTFISFKEFFYVYFFCLNSTLLVFIILSFVYTDKPISIFNIKAGPVVYICYS